MFEQINSHITRCTHLTAEELAYFHSLLEIRAVTKKTMLLQEGDFSNFEACINKGCIRNYYTAQGVKW